MCKALKLGLLAFAVLGMTFLGCDKLANPIVNQPPDDPGKVTTADFPHVEQIIAGQTDAVGTLTVYATYDNIYVRFQTYNNWYLNAYHVHVTDEPDGGWGFPVNRQGNPQIGNFDYIDTFDPDQDVLVEIPWGDWWGCDYLAFACHCNLVKIVNGNVVDTQTGWSGDHPFPGGSWATWFDLEMPKVLRLPSHKVWVQYTQVSGNTPCQFRIWGVGTGYSIPNDSSYRSFCLDQGVYIYNHPYEGYLRTSFDPFLPDYIRYNRGTNPPVLTPYGKINYLADLFMDNPGTYLNAAGIQAFQQVFWYYRGYGSQPVEGTLAYTLWQAGESHDGWYPEGGDWMAVMMDLGANVQLCFIMVDP